MLPCAPRTAEAPAVMRRAEKIRVALREGESPEEKRLELKYLAGQCLGGAMVFDSSVLGQRAA